MARDLTPEFASLLAGKIRIPGPLAELKAAYADSKPFSHVVIDRMFPDDTLDPLLTEISSMSKDQWTLVDGNPRERTLRMRSAADLGTAGEHLVSVVHSAAFLYFLSEITGIAKLLPDPYLQGSGFALMRRGDYFDVHSDRNIAYDTGLTRRIAMIIFLNKSWRPEYRGQLELWSSDGARREVSIEPMFNRTVVFEIADPNYHGVPTPLECPSDRTRQSFIVYYHSVGPNPKSTLAPHTTIFAPSLYGTRRPTVRSIARDLVPPFAVRLLKKLFRRAS